MERLDFMGKNGRKGAGRRGGPLGRKEGGEGQYSVGQECQVELQCDHSPGDMTEQSKL